MPERHVRFDRFEPDPQSGRVAEAAVGVGEPVVQVGVRAIRCGGDQIAGPREDVDHGDVVVDHAVAEGSGLDPAAGRGPADGDGLELRDDQRGQPVRQGRRDQVLVGAHATDVRGPGDRVDREDAGQARDVQTGRVRAAAGPEQVGGLLGQANASVRRDGAVAGQQARQTVGVPRLGSALGPRFGPRLGPRIRRPIRPRDRPGRSGPSGHFPHAAQGRPECDLRFTWGW